MTFLSKMTRKRSRLAVGLISGTSADGVDAAAVRIEGSGRSTKIEVIAHGTYAYESELREKVLAVSSGKGCDACTIADLNFRLGQVFADAAVEICSEGGLDPKKIDFIGSHGQTVFHRPLAQDPGMPACTLQLADPCVIAEWTGVTTVGDFRPRDIAAGGQGAPLVPLVDFLLLGSEYKSRCVLNLGGIANVTLLPKGCSLDEVIAFDTGPGNMVLDALAGVFSSGESPFDEGGALALRGRADRLLLDKLLGHPYFRLPPPKSTGRETFGEDYARDILAQAGRLKLSEAVTMRTAVALTAKTVVDGCCRHFSMEVPPDEVIVSGGGVHNKALMKALQDEFKPAKVILSDDLGLPADAKEAIAFAVLANETMSGNAGNVPSATGASRPVILGKIAP